MTGCLPTAAHNAMLALRHKRPLWVISADFAMHPRSPFHPHERTSLVRPVGSESPDWPVGSPSYLGVKLFAAASAPRSSVSRAIFWASMTSPATR